MTKPLLRIITSLCIFLVHDVAAQEFWLMPDKTKYAPGDSIKLRFNVGDNFTGDTWNLRPERIQSITLYQGGKTEDLGPKAVGGKKDHLKIAAAGEGSYVVSMIGKNAFVELSAARFNNYLKEQSLDEVIDFRKKNGLTDQPGKESYARSTKVFVQVGAKLTEDFKKKTGAQLEIIPQKNPASYKKGDAVKFTVLFEGKPLFGARAYLWNNVGNRVYSQPVHTQQDGSVEVRLFNSGAWMISVVKMVPSKEEGADWQSYWSTAVFFCE